MLLAIVTIFCFSDLSYCQTKVVLETSISADAKTVRGGGSLRYIISVENKSAGIATDVSFLHYLDDMTRFVSAKPKQGSCEGASPESNRFPHELRCKLGNIPARATALVEVEVGILEWGDTSSDENYYTGASRSFASDPPAPPTKAGNAQPSATQEAATGRSNAEKIKPSLHIALFPPHLGCENCESQAVDTIKPTSVDLEPSRNIPPRVEITSPKVDATMVRRARTLTEIPITIKASDQDGTIAKIIVIDPQYSPQPVVEDYQYKFIYEGRKWTAKELDDYLKANPPAERTATRTGKDSYQYILRNPPYGLNFVTIIVVDDGGRSTSASISLTIKGDAKVEFVVPKRNQIISPGSTLTVETLSTLNEGKPQTIHLTYIDGFNYAENGVPEMELISKNGNVYKHRYVLKNVPGDDVFSNLTAVLVEDSGAVTEASVGFLVREIPKIQITSVNEHQVFENVKEIRVNCTVLNQGSNVDLKVYIDGKYKSSTYGGYIWHGPEKGTHTVQIIATFSDVELAKSKVVTFHVK
ncbi:MAG: hypothetical protein WBD27_20080 [Pyrinomonadaceae bacterium]